VGESEWRGIWGNGNPGGKNSLRAKQNSLDLVDTEGNYQKIRQTTIETKGMWSER